MWSDTGKVCVTTGARGAVIAEFEQAACDGDLPMMCSFGQEERVTTYRYVSWTRIGEMAHCRLWRTTRDGRHSRICNKRNRRWMEYLSASRGRVKNCSCTVAFALMVAASSPALAQEPVPAGRIKVVAGSAFVVHERREMPARVGDTVYETDSLTTGADGRIGVTLRDETRISLGPRSEVRLDRFLYSPADSQFAFVLSVVRGLATYVSGRIARLSPDAVRLETPSAIVGIRGTRLAIRVGDQ
jgi:FecR protein